MRIIISKIKTVNNDNWYNTRVFNFIECLMAVPAVKLEKFCLGDL